MTVTREELTKKLEELRERRETMQNNYLNLTTEQRMEFINLRLEIESIKNQMRRIYR